MENALQMLSQPFTLGLGLGLIFFGLSCFAHFKTKMEFRRYRKHLSDKLEIESRQMELLRKEKEELAKANENLRIKTAQIADLPQNRMERELEILARAEKQMVINAPGFAPAWEHAKSRSLAEIVDEERSNTMPKRFFKKFFGPAKELPAESVVESGREVSESQSKNS